jgi:hypothetical protein
MSNLCARVSDDVVVDCDNIPVGGIEQRLTLINVDDLTSAGITLDVTNPTSLITGLELLPNKVGYEIQGIKQIMKFTNAAEIPEDSFNGMKHQLIGIKFFDNSEECRTQINKYLAGAKVFAVLERKWKGPDNKYAFLFFGMKFGLELAELVDNSDENDGAIMISLATPAGFKEPYLPHIYRDTDYETSKTAFNNKFAGPVVP